MLLFVLMILLMFMLLLMFLIAFIPPRWVERQTDANITWGESKTFVCKPEGRPLPEVTWYKDGVPVQENEFVTVSEDGYRYVVKKLDTTKT